MLVSSPVPSVVDHLADLALWEAELAADPQHVASSLAQRLAQVPDPRDPRVRQHPLVVVLVLTACATSVAGNDCLAAIWQWAAGAGQPAARISPWLVQRSASALESRHSGCLRDACGREIAGRGFGNAPRRCGPGDTARGTLPRRAHRDLTSASWS